ncbi:hypothetical protein N7454_000503 [Penicillium verhagenii]|nr:hypothetical protein N7454_000503 [Penicillium verhagenii]
MTSTEDATVNVQKWQELERLMVEAYKDDERRRRDDLALVDINEDVKEYMDVPATGPKERVGGVQSVWPEKEAAFQAYKALWEYGLLNDNLLPLTKKSELRFGKDNNIPALVDCEEQYDPFVELAHAWSSADYRQTDIIFSRDGCVDEDIKMSIMLPRPITMPDSIPLYWDIDKTYHVSFTCPKRLPTLTPESLHLVQEITKIYLQGPSSRILPLDRDFVVLFMPTIPLDQLQEWTNQYQGSYNLLEHYKLHGSEPPAGIIRDTAMYSEPRLFREWVFSGDGAKVRVDTECQSLPKRRNFLQPRTAAEAGEEGGAGPTKMHLIPASTCTVDRLPAKEAMFGLLISAIIDRMEATMVAKLLNDTILKGVGIQNLNHVLTAITTPIAQASTDYQIYEFFGDSVLKFTVACQLFFNQPTWHEGYLSEGRDQLVQNKHLAHAALETGLDRFILTKRFTPRKWEAPFISKKSTVAPSRRTLSSKVLADVVEALIGAAYVDGGVHRAQACLHRFLPKEVDIFTSDISLYFTLAQGDESNLINPVRLTSLIGYTFKNRTLLTEAFTHPSCEHDLITQSFQRIEFLGDSVLDMLVIPLLAAHPVEMPPGKMTLIKHSVVNANLLAFFCMELSATENSLRMAQNDSPGSRVESEESRLWRFLRFNGPTIQGARDACLLRFDALRDEILEELRSGKQYPWELLARLQADKFFSDILESVLGAIFIDSSGDLEQCEAFVERTGLLTYMRRILTDDVDVVHPRNAAQTMVKFVGVLVFKSRRIEKKKGVPTTYQCAALLNKKEVAFVQGCGSSEEAEVRVAYLVIERVKNGSIETAALT